MKKNLVLFAILLLLGFYFAIKGFAPTSEVNMFIFLLYIGGLVWFGGNLVA